MKSSTESDRSSTRIQSVARACRLLLFVADQHDGCAAKSVSDAFGLSLPTTYHLLNTLVSEGMLTKDSRRRYSIGPHVGALSDAFLRQMSAPEYLLDPLHQLAEATGETTYLTAWRGHEIRVLAAVEGDQAVRVAGLHSGYYGNGHARASGKLLLAYTRREVRDAYVRANPLQPVTDKTLTSSEALEAELAAILQRGYAYDLEEFATGVCCIAAPVLASGVAIAAYTISAPSARFHERHDDLRDTLLAIVGQVASLASADDLAAADVPIAPME